MVTVYRPFFPSIELKQLGVDIKIKHNLFAISDENIEIDYNRNFCLLCASLNDSLK